MKLFERTLLVGGMLVALAGVSFAQDDGRPDRARDGRTDRVDQSDDRWDRGDGDRDDRWGDRQDRGDRDARDRDDRGDRDRRWDRSGERSKRIGDRWDRAERRWSRLDRSWDRREARHDFRTHRGMRHGEISRGEAMRLRLLRHRIELMQRRARADGRLSMRERIMIRRMMGREGRTIGRFDHNERYESY